MNQHRFISTLLCTAMVLFLISCNSSGNGEKSGTDTTANKDTSATTTTTPVVNTTVTTPQNMVTVMHKVKDFSKWMEAYDGHDSARLAAGLHSYVIGRGWPDSNMVFVAMKADDMDKAKAFSKDPGLKKAMEKGGVVGAPTINFVITTFQDTATIDSKLRARTLVTVKDWAAWQKVFDSTRQVTTDNGLMLRAYGHDATDTHKVYVVSAITDTAKAMAYWKSDLLKQRMAAGGVTGKPQRFFYQIVKKY
jgi:hypothetical protein